jgi:hypothetical protein
MNRRYRHGMRIRPSFALAGVLVLSIASDAAAQVSATATAGATILERPVRIVGAQLGLDPRRLPAQAQLSRRACDPGAPPTCRMIVVDMP